MSKLIVFTSLTLDGVMQAPGRPDEDLRGGFQHGGWATPYTDSVLGSLAGQNMATTGAIVLGRRTYQDFYSYWPKQADNPYTEVLNNTRKYVVSTTLKEPLAWSNSTLIKGDVSEAIARLKAEQDKDFVVLVSGELVRTLMKHDLVDRYMFLIHPLVLGSGRRLFADDGTFFSLHLIATKTSTTGVVVATYEPEKADDSTKSMRAKD